MMHAIAYCVILLGAGQENLLANAELTVGNDSKPAAWSVFLGEMEGAWARVGVGPSPGTHAIGLHAPESYAEDTINNWSQVVEADLSGQPIRLSGWVRAEEAAEAAIWIQCLRGNPLRVVGGATSTTLAPITGTTPWTPVSVACNVPRGTEAVIVRCVMRAPGTAWFGELRLSTFAGNGEDIETLDPTDSSEQADLEAIADELRMMVGDLAASNLELQRKIDDMHREIAEQRWALGELGASNRSAQDELESIEVRHPLVPAQSELERNR